MKEIKDIIVKLHSKKSSDRRRAAKEIGKNKVIELSGELYKSYIKEKEDIRTWETQKEMIISLGLINVTVR